MPDPSDVQLHEAVGAADDADPLTNEDYARVHRLYRKLGLGEVYAPAMRHQALLLREAAREALRDKRA